MRLTGVLAFSLILLLSACTLCPKPMTVNERYCIATRDVQQLFNPKCNCQQIDFYEALARGLKYNLDFRIKLANIALQANQLKVAIFTLFPTANFSGSLYKRNNQFSSFGITTTGQPTDILNSTPNALTTARAGLTWSILDFGLGYVRARQQGERILIAQEESRKQVQQLSQDVLTAYWEAYSAQELKRDAENFQALLEQAKNKLEIAIHDRTVPKENLLNYQASLLEGNRKIVQLKHKYNKAMVDLKRLMSMPIDQEIVLLPPPHMLTKMEDLTNIDFKKLDAIALVSRPELASQNYQQRIAEFGLKTAIIQALPGVTLNMGWNSNSNKYLLNTIWVDRSMDVAWNLLNLASLPTAYQAAKTQVCYEKLKLMALTLTVLTETRYAYSHYQTLNDEYNIVRQQTQTADAIYQLNKNRQLASLASSQQVILAKLRAIAAKMDENLLLAEMSKALGELYLSIGTDLLPRDVQCRSLPEAIQLVSQNYTFHTQKSFTDYVNQTYERIFGPCHAYTLQLYGCYDSCRAKALQQKCNFGNCSRYGVKTVNGRDLYVVTYGLYKTPQEARANIASLAPTLRNFKPWVIKTDDVNWLD